MNHVIVTGGSGFIGSNLALEIQQRYPKSQVTVIDDFRSASFKNLLGFNGDVVAINVSDKSWMACFENRPVDIIFHLASITDTTVLDEQKMMYDNVEGFRNILEFARHKKAEVVYASSAAVYGSQNTPMRESDGGKPNNIYGYSKWTMENLARFYQGKVKAVGVRYFNVFGPREYYKEAAASMIYQLYLQMKVGKRPRIFKDGEQKRDHVYVKDVVEATLLARNAKENTVMNVGTGKATSFNAIIDALNEALGTQLKTDYFDNPYNFYQNFTQADLSHTTATIGYTPRYTTREGILDYVKNYLSARD
jgi:ADP-L-glycero-D-manno-heptose 6-epimerase